MPAIPSRRLSSPNPPSCCCCFLSSLLNLLIQPARKISRDVLAKSPISSDSWCPCKSELIWIKVNDNWVLSGHLLRACWASFQGNFLCPHSLWLTLPCLFLHPKAIFLSLCLILLTWFLSLVTEVSEAEPGSSSETYMGPFFQMRSWPLSEFQQTAAQGWVSGAGDKAVWCSVSLRPFLSLIHSSQGCFS